MALTFVSSDPATATVDFFLNKSISLTFNEPVSSGSLTDNIVYLVDTSNNETVPATVALKATDTKVIIIDPLVVLKENTNYKVYVIGTDQGVGYSLEATNGDLLVETVLILISTGDSLYQIDVTLEKEAANLTLEGDLFLPTNVKALGYNFTVDKVRPKNHGHGVAVGLTGDYTIRFTFTKALLTGLASYSDWASVNCYPIINDANYLASGDSMGVYDIPDHTISIADTDLLVTFQNVLPQNLCVSIDLNTDIKSIDNDQYGGNLSYLINTDLSVDIYGPEMIKRELSSISSQLNDDYIGALLFKNTIFLWEKTGRGISLSPLSFPAKKYIMLSTMLDIMEDKDYQKFVLAGTRRQLGDLNVSVDNMVGRLALKIARVQKEREVALETLYKGWQFKALAGSTRSSMFNGDRLWYDVNSRYTEPSYKFYQADVPASNIHLNRHAKTNNPVW
jgi:hypothetical protein